MDEYSEVYYYKCIDLKNKKQKRSIIPYIVFSWKVGVLS